jgi:hypothetical protein
MSGGMKVFALKSAAIIRWCAVLVVVVAVAVFGQTLMPKASPDLADTQPEYHVTSSLKIPLKLKAAASLGTFNNGHGLSPINATGTFYFSPGSKEITGDVAIDGNGEYVYSVAASWSIDDWTTSGNYVEGFRIWKPGAIFGITHNGHDIGVLKGTGKVDFSNGVNVTGDVTADGKGGFVYSNIIGETTPSKYYDGFESKDGYRMWKAGTIIGITNNDRGIGVLSGAGTLDFNASGAHLTGDVAADGHGGYIYSNVKSETTTGDYWDGLRRWKAGAVLGVLDNGKSIGVLSGTGKLDYVASGAHVTGDVTADGKGGLVYSNVTNGTTTSEYWDGAKLWKPGAVLGVKGRSVEVISGTGRLDFLASGAHVTGDVTADGKGGFVYKNVNNGTTTSEFWDGTKLWKPGAVLGVKNSGKAISIISGTAKVD